MSVGKLTSVCLTLLLSIGVSVCYARASWVITNQQPFNEQTSEQHTAWVAESLKRMQTVKPGMSRAELLKVFTTEGGLSTGLRRIYVYRECPLFKVDVEFTPANRPARDSNGRVTLFESDADIIKSISRPYLEWPVSD
jgi:hypothetical protein